MSVHWREENFLTKTYSVKNVFIMGIFSYYFRKNTIVNVQPALWKQINQSINTWIGDFMG